MSDFSSLRRVARERAVREGMVARHNPKNLASAVLLEASRLALDFTWMSGRDAVVLRYQPASLEVPVRRMVEVLYTLIRLADELDIDLAGAAMREFTERERREALVVNFNVGRHDREAAVLRRAAVSVVDYCMSDFHAARPV